MVTPSLISRSVVTIHVFSIYHIFWLYPVSCLLVRTIYWGYFIAKSIMKKTSPAHGLVADESVIYSCSISMKSSSVVLLGFTSISI